MLVHFLLKNSLIYTSAEKKIYQIHTKSRIILRKNRQPHYSLIFSINLSSLINIYINLSALTSSYKKVKKTNLSYYFSSPIKSSLFLVVILSYYSPFFQIPLQHIGTIFLLLSKLWKLNLDTFILCLFFW